MESDDQGVSSSDWAADITRRVGDAMRTRRNELGISAAALSDRTAKLGYPVTRSTIAKIESGSRASKLDLTELLILAQALQSSPAALLYGDAPDGTARPFPSAPQFNSGGLYQWWTGEGLVISLWEPERDNESIARAASLRRLLRARNALDRAKFGHHRGEVTSDYVSELAAEEAEAARQAARDGWTVNPNG